MDYLIDHLDFKSDNKSIIDELKGVDVPILLYGGGSYARDVLRYLNVNNISVDYIFADNVLEDILRDYNLKRIDINEINFSCVVIMGFAKYLMGKQLADKNKNIRKIFYPVLMPYDEITGLKRSKVMEMLDKISNGLWTLGRWLFKKVYGRFLEF